MTKKSVRKIPKFKTYADEAKFWDNHSLADYWPELKDVNLLVELNKPRDETLVLRIQKSLKDNLQKMAKSRGLNVSTLARILLMEKFQASK